MNYCYLFIGPSGSGKTSLAENCFSPDQKIVSYTTRPARLGEKNGQDYHFISKDTFQQMIQRQEFAEYDHYDGQYYGISNESIESGLRNGDCYDPITASGFWNLRRRFGDAVVPVWITISKETLMDRLKNRQTDSKEIDRRLALFDEDQANLTKLEALPDLIIIDGERSLEAMSQQLRESLK
ncbi:guanylate kinase [Enterococcus florum]|uniref:Guanylate kinase n=1 Tax=Enterococcus florum TaxID=2480627 RepID=A0A4P5PGH2_9ENTE|nr:AAA family ATPase [Enterococcus florum]GCF95874.1 guanylate kinase [Enterococcus florum]